MLLKITTNLEIQHVKNSMKYRDLRESIGCETPEIVYPKYLTNKFNAVMIVDEDGYRKQLPVNPIASTLYSRFYEIVGDVLIVGYKHLRDGDDICDIDPQELPKIEVLLEAIRQQFLREGV